MSCDTREINQAYMHGSRAKKPWKLEGKYHFRELGVDGKTVLNTALNK